MQLYHLPFCPLLNGVYVSREDYAPGANYLRVDPLFGKVLLSRKASRYPADIWCENDVVLTSMLRDHVASTLIQRHFGTKCPLGSHISCSPLLKTAVKTEAYLYTRFIYGLLGASSKLILKLAINFVWA